MQRACVIMNKQNENKHCSKGGVQPSDDIGTYKLK